MDYNAKYPWAVDFDIWCGKLSEAEIKNFVKKLRAAITANGNEGFCDWDFDSNEPRISIWGDDGGNNGELEKLFSKLDARGCRFEAPEYDQPA